MNAVLDFFITNYVYFIMWVSQDLPKFKCYVCSVAKIDYDE